MKKRIVASVIATSLAVGVPFGSWDIAFAAEDKGVEITREVKQYLYSANSVGTDVIEMYEQGGWAYNPEENYFVRTVVYENSPIVIDGEEYTTDSEGTVDIEPEASEVEIESLTGRETVTVDLDDYDEELVITENISVNNVMETMDIIDVVNSDEYDGIVEIGQKNGERPSRGDIVACNRFNGYLGNGKYYSNELKPQAIKNFYASDCDWALYVYPHCLLDFSPVAKFRYCSLVEKKNYGRCSALAKKVNGKSHSKYFHMHKGWKS